MRPKIEYAMAATLAMLVTLWIAGCAASDALTVSYAESPSVRSVPTAAAVEHDAVRDADAGGGFRRDIQSGTLTAGSFDDNANPGVFEQFVAGLTDGPTGAAFLDIAAPYLEQRATLRLTDSAGKPLGSVSVKVESPGGVITLLTRSDGRLVLTAKEAGGKTARVTFPAEARTGGTSAATHSIPLDGQTYDLVIGRLDSAPPRVLDLAFVVDCTGSMADELEYLKVEIRGIAQCVRQAHPRLRQRFALICYRDKGDEYVTRSFDFTENLDTFIDRLGKQRASGGGDYEEAVHTALDAANQLRWSDESAARVLFHIGDAPPHQPDMRAAFDAVERLKHHGIAIYPVAASGVNPMLECLMRAAAITTGAQYLFITDDSGVGNRHAEPHIPAYDVERLAELMTRMIASEVSGTLVKAEPGSIVRKVRAVDPVAAQQQ